MRRFLLCAAIVLIAIAMTLWLREADAQGVAGSAASATAEELLIEANRRVILFGDQVRGLREENARLKRELDDARKAPENPKKE